MPDREDIVTLYVLKSALARTFKKLSGKEATEQAYHLLNFFGDEDEIIDNILDTKDREVFYQLEEEGLLKTRHEEVLLYDGRNWRTHYWLWNKPNIFSPVEKQPQPEATIYARLADFVWQRGLELKINNYEQGIASTA